MNREDMLSKIDALYEGRMTGDQSAFDKILAPEAAFSFEGDTSITSAFPGGESHDPLVVAQELFEQVDMLERKQLDAVVEGNRVAVLVQATLRIGTAPPFEHLMFDLWEFDEHGRITSGRQFQDTAKIVQELTPASDREPANGPASAQTEQLITP